MPSYTAPVDDMMFLFEKLRDNKNYGKDYDYAEFRDGFKAELFDPKEWASIFKRSGAKYVVLTSKHHDGYCLWPNKEASESYNMPWNSTVSGPKRDLVGDLTTAVKDEGIKMGLYYSIWDWYNPYWTKQQQQIMSSGSLSVDTADNGNRKSKFSNEEVTAAKAGLDKYVHEVMYPQLKQLMKDYEPALLFSDGDWWMDYKKWQTLPLLAWVLNNVPNENELVLNDRWGKVRGKHGSYYTTEYGSGFSDGSKPWEENRGIGMYFGINRDRSFTLNEIGEQFSLTRERVRQIKEKAIRRLAHKTRSEPLRVYLGQ